MTFFINLYNFKLYSFTTTSLKSMPFPRVECPRCLKEEGQIVWVIAGKNCPKCGKLCSLQLSDDDSANINSTLDCNSDNCIINSCPANEFNTTDLVGVYVLSIFVILILLIAILLAIRSYKKKSILLKPHRFIITSFKSMPVPGVKCPNCLKQDQVVWVMPGNNCPKCGVDCSCLPSTDKLSTTDSVTNGEHTKLSLPVSSVKCPSCLEKQETVFVVSGKDCPKCGHVNVSCSFDEFNFTNLIDINIYTFVIVSCLLLLAAILIIFYTSKKYITLTPYKYITTSLKNMPVPGVKCPSCLKRGETVWVIPGKNCPKCGTSCSDLVSTDKLLSTDSVKTDVTNGEHTNLSYAFDSISLTDLINVYAFIIVLSSLFLIITFVLYSNNSIFKPYNFIYRSLKSMPVPGVKCPSCLKKGETVWVIPGKNCPICGTPCSRSPWKDNSANVDPARINNISDDCCNTSCPADEFNLFDLIGVNLFTFSIVISVSIILIIFTTKRYITLIPYNFVKTSSKSMPVPGVKCPNCLKDRNETVWVIPGKNCPKCGTPCSRYPRKDDINVDCAIDQFNLTGLIGFNIFTLFIFSCLLLLAAILIILYTSKKCTSLAPHKYIKTSLKSMPVPGVKCPNCLKDRNETVWVIPGKNCPKCGTPCSRYAWKDESNINCSTVNNINDDYVSTNYSINEFNLIDLINVNTLLLVLFSLFVVITLIIYFNTEKFLTIIPYNFIKTPLKSMPVPGVKCPNCLKRGETVWVIPGKNCPKCGTPCSRSPWKGESNINCSAVNEINDNDINADCAINEFNLIDLVTSSPLDQFIIRDFVIVVILMIIVFSLTDIGVYIVLSMLAIISTLSSAVAYGKAVPNKANVSEESLFVSLYNIVTSQIDELKGQRYFCLVYTVFVFILINNLIGMTPYAFSTTSHFILTFFLSFTVVLGATILGLAIHILKFFSILVPHNCPLPLLPLLVLIETISYLARNISLGLRLAANVLSGHMLLNILSGFGYKILKSSYLGFIISLIPLSFIVAFTGLEIGIAFIQSQVFAVLSSSYIKDGLKLH